jgi:hypothetical protein
MGADRRNSIKSLGKWRFCSLTRGGRQKPEKAHRSHPPKRVLALAACDKNSDIDPAAGYEKPWRPPGSRLA